MVPFIDVFFFAHFQPLPVLGNLFPLQKKSPFTCGWYPYKMKYLTWNYRKMYLKKRKKSWRFTNIYFKALMYVIFLALI